MCANNASMVCREMGTLILSHGNNMLVIDDCLFIPGCMTLISVHQLTKLGLYILLFNTGLCAYKSPYDVRMDTPFIKTEKRIADKMWTLPLKAASSYGCDTPDKSAKSEQSFIALQDSAFVEWSAAVLHEAHAHAPLRILQMLYPHLQNVEKLPPCDACFAQSLRQSYSKKYKSTDLIKKSKLTKIKFSVDAVQDDLVDGAVDLADPFTDTPSKSSFSEPSSANPSNHVETTRPREVKIDDPQLVLMTGEADPNIEVTTIDMGLVAEEETPNHRFGRYLNSDTKYVKTESVRGYRYLFVVVDKDTRVTFGFLGVSKSDFEPIAKRWIRKFHNAYQRYPEYWKFDQGGEFLNNDLLVELQKRGITFVFSTTAAHNQNAYSERKIGVVWNAVMKMLAGSAVPMQFWCYCAVYAIFVMNHLPHRGISNGIPLTRANMRTHYNQIYPFGCEVWFIDENAVSNESREKRGVFLGISTTKMGYDALDIETRQVIQTRNVHFMTTRKPFLIAQKPCKIHLDFGTWPSVNPSDRVSLPGIPSTVIEEHPESDERGDFRVVTTPPIVRQNQSVQPPLSPGASIVPLIAAPQPPIVEPDVSIVEPRNIPPTPPSMSPIPEFTPDRTNDTRWSPDLFGISPEPRGERSPVFPSPTDELDEKHTDDRITSNKTVNNDDQTVNNGDREVNNVDQIVNNGNNDETEKVDNAEKRNISNPMSKIVNIPDSVTPSEPNVEPTDFINTPLDDSVAGSEPPLKGIFKPLNLRPKGESNPKRKKGRPKKVRTEQPKKYLLDLNTTNPPIRFTADKDLPHDQQYEIEEIIDRKIVEGARGKDKYQYKVKWKDLEDVQYPEPSWIPGSNVDNATRQWYNKKYHPKPTKLPKGGATAKSDVAPRSRSVTGSMKLRNRSVVSLNERKLTNNVTYAANVANNGIPSENVNSYDYFGRILPGSDPIDRERAENLFVSWQLDSTVDKSRVDDMMPIDQIEKSLHQSFETIAAINSIANRHSSLRTNKTSKKGKKKVRINDNVTITDVTDEELAKTDLALQLKKMNATEYVYADHEVYEEVLHVQDYRGTETSNSDDSKPKGKKQRPKHVKRTPIPPPSKNRIIVPVSDDDISLEQLTMMSERSFSDFIAGLLLQIDPEECLQVQVPTTNAVSKEELTREAANTQKEAYSGPDKDKYVEAEHLELKGLDAHGTFEETYCPPGRTPITCRWVYDLKRDKEGKVVLYKARLVVHGFKQIAGIDFQKTFSSTAQLRTFRFVVSIAVARGYSMTQYDISQAFLHGPLEEELYMNFPPGYPSADQGKVLRLLKGLYGLKQASRIWQKALYKALKELGLVQCKTDSGVLRWPGTDAFALVVCWVDDLIIVSSDPKITKKIEAKLNKEFMTKMMGELELYVGIVVEMEKNGDVVLHQGPYNRKVCAKFEVLRKFHANAPAQSDRLSKVDCPTNSKDAVDYPYMSVTGSLLYSAICTRPDIFYAVMQLARFNSNPGKAHVRASEQCLRYLEETPDLGIKYTAPKDKNAKIVINAFVDSDWGGCPDTRRSTMGYIIQVCGGPVAWKSKLMQTMALSSCEAEFMALTEVCRELMWMCRFLDEIGIEYDIPNIYCDSSSAINWAEDPVQHQRNKHVEIKYYYCRDVIADGKAGIFKIHTTNNVSDMMTKPVGRQTIQVLRSRAHGYEPVVFDD